ncbi:MAG: citramalate synthase [Spirochaetia bacterium]
MSRKITIYDTTLRDGMQGLEISYSLEDKMKIARKLDEMGVDYIEGGFPMANEKEAAFFERFKTSPLQHAKLVAFGSTRKPGGTAKTDKHIQALLEAETPAVIIVGKTWKAHVEMVLKTNISENLAMIYDSIQYLKSEGREVFFDLEHFFDGYIDDADYAAQVLSTATEAGADELILCDTNGGMLPMDVTRILSSLPKNELAPLGVHFHNDTGTAVACSLAGIEAGADHVQGTVNGWGERCGNANLCVVVPNVSLKMGRKTNMDSNMEGLTNLSRFVAEIANIIPDKRQPYVGEAAFTHKAGQHVDVISKADNLMEHIDSRLVGNHRKVVLSELSGKSTIVNKLTRYGTYTKDSDVVTNLVTVLKNKESGGYEYEVAEASFDLLIRKTLDKYTPLHQLSNYHLESYKAWNTPAKTVGRMFLSVGGRTLMGAAVGTGPVETLDKSLREALNPIHPFIKKISLIDYRVRVLNPEDAAASKVRVFITSSDHQGITWDTVGVSENIVEASWEALVDSFEFYYNNYILE